MKTALFSLFALAGALMAPGVVNAQDTAPKAVLEIPQGSVMALVDNEYRTARSGQVVEAGQSLMVADQSTAVVVFGNRCKQTFRGPQVYVVPATCTSGAAVDTNATKAAAVIIGAGALSAAILGSMDSTPAPPISAGPRSNP